MKKIKVLFYYLFTMILLSGCGNIGIASNTTISERGSGVFSFKVAYDYIIFDSLDGSILKNNKDAPKDEQIRKYIHNEDYLEEYRLNFDSLEDLNKKLAFNENGFKVSVVKKIGLFRDTYAYEMRFLKDFDKSAIKTSFLENNKINQSITKYSDNSIDKFLSNVKFTSEVVLPGKIISTNAVGDTGGNLVWTYNLSQINSQTTMTATYVIDKTKTTALAGLIGTIIIVLIIYLVVRAKRLKVS